MSAPGGEACEVERRAFVPNAAGPSGTAGAAGSGAQSRVRAIRIAEYTPFPRVYRYQHKRLGFTSDDTGPILRVAARNHERPGTLLRLVVRGIDGRPQLETLARVAWCQENDGGYLSLGLAVVDENHRRARLARPSLEERRGAITA